DYLRRYSFANASWTDLIDILAPRASEPLPAWSHAWVEEAARPRIDTTLRVENSRIASLVLVQRDPSGARGLTWTEQLDVVLGYADRLQHVPARLSAASTAVAAAEGLPAPAFVLPSGGGLGYGEFHLDPASREWLAEHLPDIEDALTRGSAWVTMW